MKKTEKPAPMVYLDWAATTPIESEVYYAMQPYMTDEFGNPSSAYLIGETNKIAIGKARMEVAELINADAQDVYFTSGGTESNNWAIRGVCQSLCDHKQGNHIITTPIEHASVLESCKYMEKHGFDVSYVPVSSIGLVDYYALEDMITDQTIMISVMMANNEIGTIEPIKKIAEIAHRKGVLLHVDAVQAFGHIPIDVKEMGIDILSASAHKIGGPKGVGCFYCNHLAVPFLEPYMLGGHQELGMRASTENVAGIVGFGKAAMIAKRDMYKNMKYVHELRNYTMYRLRDIHDISLNGPLPHDERVTDRLPNNLNLTIDGINGTQLQSLLADRGIYTSVGSACNTGIPMPSHVLKAIGMTDQEALCSLRITLGHTNTKEDIDRFIKAFKNLIKTLKMIKG